MTAVASMRALLLSMLLLTGAACRDVGIVGEGSACPAGCAASERCVSGTCVPRNDGVAGDDEHEEEDEEEQEEEPTDADGSEGSDGL